MYFERVLQTQLARDEESAEMLDFIKAGMVFDFGYVNSALTEQLGLLGTKLLNSAHRSLLTFYEQQERIINRAIERFIENNTN